MASRRQILEQQRAASAWTMIETVTGEKLQKKYGTLARKLPTMIQMNGLGSTLAFLKSKYKKDEGHQYIFDHLSNWVAAYVDSKTPQDFDRLVERATKEKQRDLLDIVRKEDMDVYRRATTEAIAYGIWLKRYVEAKDWGSVEGDDSR